MRVENWIGRPCIPPGQFERNVAHSQKLGLRSLSAVGLGPLLVVGGGPSAAQHLDEFRGAEILAINGACGWLRQAGIASTFFTLDALPEAARWAEAASRAIVAASCDPAVFAALEGADVTVFDARPGKTVLSGTTSATAAPVVGLTMGYRPVIFYGCEGSYPPDRTHAYFNEPRIEEFDVKIGGTVYRTAPDFLYQSIELAAIFRAVNELDPDLLQEHSGGLLRAMLEHGDDYDIVWMSDAAARMRVA